MPLMISWGVAFEFSGYHVSNVVGDISGYYKATRFKVEDAPPVLGVVLKLFKNTIKFANSIKKALKFSSKTTFKKHHIISAKSPLLFVLLNNSFSENPFQLKHQVPISLSRIKNLLFLLLVKPTMELTRSVLNG